MHESEITFGKLVDFYEEMTFYTCERIEGLECTGRLEGVNVTGIHPKAGFVRIVHHRLGAYIHSHFPLGQEDLGDTDELMRLFDAANDLGPHHPMPPSKRKRAKQPAKQFLKYIDDLEVARRSALAVAVSKPCAKKLLRAK
jgi:hypothetical protein